MRGTAKLVRYADDFVIVFAHKEDADRVLRALPQRLERYGLRLSPEKTRLIPFRRPRDDDDGGGPSTFDFLGFTWYWRRRYRGWHVNVKTQTSRLTRALAAISAWCRQHRHDAVREQHLGLKRRLQGHYNYFAVSTNAKQVWRLLYWATRILRKSLVRRSQRSRLTWARFQLLERALPLPRPKLNRCCGSRLHETSARKSRMVEISLSGSGGGCGRVTFRSYPTRRCPALVRDAPRGSSMSASRSATPAVCPRTIEPRRRGSSMFASRSRRPTGRRCPALVRDAPRGRRCPHLVRDAPRGRRCPHLVRDVPRGASVSGSRSRRPTGVVDIRISFRDARRVSSNHRAAPL